MTREGEGLERTLHERLAVRLVEQIRRGDAPWQRAVRPGSVLPYNPHNNRRFHGVNMIALLAQSREDARWLTYQQAASRGAHVRLGERGTLVHCWQFHEQRPGAGAVPLLNPRLATAVVFNGEQIDGLESPQQVSPPSDGCARADELVRLSGANIVESRRAQYDCASDTMLLPSRDRRLADPEEAAGALRALCHWTGHEQRLARDVRAPLGSTAAAAEELRAAIYITTCAHEFGLALPCAARLELHDAWVRLLEQDPLEIGRAAADAERVRTFLLHPNQHSLVLEQRVQGARERAPANEVTMRDAQRQYLAVPYVERPDAWALGARWDGEARCMYIGPNADHDALARWLPRIESSVGPTTDAREEFAAVLRSLGLEVTGAHPIMDGRRHRLRAEGDRGRATAGYYVGHLDGMPNGFAGNYRTGQAMPWSARGCARSPEEIAQLRAQAAQAAAVRAQERRKLELAVAARVQSRVDQLLPVGTRELPYLVRKQIGPTSGALVVPRVSGRRPDWWPFASWPCQDGTICLPARDAGGRMWTMQYIAPDGDKRFEPNGFKRGCFHVIGARELAAANALVIAEGYATAVTIHEVLQDAGVVVIAGFDSGNLPDVATGLRARFPRMPIVVAGDNDERLLHKPPFKNVGLEKANAAADAVRGVAVSPLFPRGSDSALTDFNDLATLGAAHRAAVGRQLRGALERARHHQLRARTDEPRALTRAARA